MIFCKKKTAYSRATKYVSDIYSPVCGRGFPHAHTRGAIHTVHLTREILLYNLHSSCYYYNMAKKSKKTEPLIDQIRQAILDCGQSRYRIAKQTGVSESALCQFCNGHRGLSMEALNTIGEYLALKVVMTRKQQKEE
jgi:hypothetical protein